MIREHAISIKGKSHIQSGKPLQDAYRIVTLPNGYRVAAVADGVGSCLHSAKGAEIAVKSVTDFIYNNFPLDGCSIPIKSMLRTSFGHALIQIQREAMCNRHSLSDYDTTLMVVVYGGGNKPTYIASCGDGGVVGLKMNGAYEALNVRQNHEGHVIPLRAGYEFWTIDEFTEPLASVLISTDGLMDQFRNNNLNPGFYIPLLMLFADPFVIQYLKRKGVNISKVVTHGQTGYNKVLLNALYYVLHRNYRFNKVTVSKIIGDIMRNGTPFELLRKIQDDKTFVCLYNTFALPKPMNIQYYAEPDWKEVSANLQKKLYPSLFEEQKPTLQEGEEPVSVQSKPLERRIEIPNLTDEINTRIVLRISKNE